MRKSVRHKIQCLIALAVFGVSPAALGFAPSAGSAGTGTFWNKQSTKLGFSLITYSGTETESFSGKTGFGGEIVTERGHKTFAAFGKVRGEYSSTSATFEDGGADSVLTYQMMMGEALLGIKVGLFPANRFTPYISGAGVAGLASLTFTSSSLTTLNKSETATILGYEVGAGVELEFKREYNQKFLVWGEIQSRKSSGDLAGKGDFALDGLRMVFGVGW